MLYKNFLVCIMSCAVLAMINMIYDQHWQYIILPIGIIIWGLYIFFKENDRNYLKRNGIDPDNYDSSFFDFFDGGYNYQNNYYGYNNTPRRNGNTITWNEGGRTITEDGFNSDHLRYQSPTARNWQDPRYKGMVKKCKRNFKITIENDKEHEEKPNRTALFLSPHHSGARSGQC